MIPEPTCAMCGEEYCLRDGCEPTKYCDICAHIAAEAAERELSEARDRIEAFADAIECYYAEKTLACQRADAAERERDELRKRHRENEQQLCDIAAVLGGDARDVKGDGPHTIAALVKQRFDELRAEVERLKRRELQWRVRELQWQALINSYGWKESSE